MSFRFRRTMKIMPGVRLNFSRSGISASVGTRGATTTIGKKGLYANVGIPGSGISYRTKLSGTKSIKQKGSHSELYALSLDQDGALTIESNGVTKLLSGQKLSQLIKKKPEIQGQVEKFLQERCATLNDDINTLINLYKLCKTPLSEKMSAELTYVPSAPETIKTKTPSFLKWFCVWIIGAVIFGAIYQGEPTPLFGILLTLCVVTLAYIFEIKKRNVARKERVKQIVEAEERNRSLIVQWEEASKDPLKTLDMAFNSFDWPRATLIDYELKNSDLWLDIDLPEVEDMPSEVWEIRKSGLGLSKKTKSDTKVREDYARHVHSICLVASSLAFWASPEISRVIVSGFTQRLDKTMGNIEDDYIISVKITRDSWEKVTSSYLDNLDHIAALDTMEIIKAMSARCIFKKIEPFQP